MNENANVTSRWMSTRERLVRNLWVRMLAVAFAQTIIGLIALPYALSCNVSLRTPQHFLFRIIPFSLVAAIFLGLVEKRKNISVMGYYLLGVLGFAALALLLTM